MNTAKAEKALHQLAQREGINVDAMRHEIETAINIALENPDPKTQAFWKSVPHKGACPTPEEVILYAVALIKDQ